MTTSFPMQFLLSTNQSNLMAMNAIAQGMLNATERVTVLNIETSRTAAEYAANGLRLFQAGDAKSILTLKSDGLPSPREATVAYFRSVQDISSSVQGELTKVISSHTEEATDAVVAMLDDVERASPESLAAVVATTVKSAVSNARTVYDSMLTTGLQAVETTTASLAKATATMDETPPAAKARKRA